MPKKWTRRADARPDELAEAALELCAQRGIHATRVADVAAHAGVTVGTVYRYFRDKDALVDAALRSAVPPAPRAPVADRPGAVTLAIADCVRRWGAFFRDAGARSVRVALSDPARDANGPRGVLTAAADELGALIREGIDRGELRSDLDPIAVGRAIVSGLALGPVFGDRASDEALVDAMTAVVTRGLRPDGPSWRPAGA